MNRLESPAGLITKGSASDSRPYTLTSLAVPASPIKFLHQKGLVLACHKEHYAVVAVLFLILSHKHNLTALIVDA